MALSRSVEAVDDLTARYNSFTLEDEELGLMPEGVEVEGGAAVAPGQWIMVARFLTDKLVKLEFMQYVMVPYGV